MSEKKADEKKAAKAAKATPAPAPTPEDGSQSKPEWAIADGLIADLDRVHVRTPRY
jgi:hypothetical protein